MSALLNDTRPSSRQPAPPHAECVFRGVLFDVYQWEQELFDGNTATFEQLKRPDTVVVVPVTSGGKVVIVEQEQPGKSPFVGLPGGRIDAGEEPETAAHRELREETGYGAPRLELWSAIQPVSKLNWAVYTYIAHGAESLGAQALDAGERIVPREVSFDEFVDIAASRAFAEIEVALEILRAARTPQGLMELKNRLGIASIG